LNYIADGLSDSEVFGSSTNATPVIASQPEVINFFWAGSGMGLLFGGTAFTLRIVRQAGRTAPEV
jgi:hypothetical protein